MSSSGTLRRSVAWRLDLVFLASAANFRCPPFVAELIAKLEVFGSFPGLSLTGEIRTSLESKTGIETSA
jgi:hypothetical protein